GCDFCAFSFVGVCVVFFFSLFVVFFFFSSRRRHTSSTRDWSSDVCSSDLSGPRRGGAPSHRFGGGAATAARSASVPRPPTARARSEERRVGKECKSRGSRAPGKKQKPQTRQHDKRRAERNWHVYDLQ